MTMNDDDLMQKLLSTEGDFLDALRGGPQMLAAYRQTLSVLPDLLSTATKTGIVGVQTLSLAHTVASRISKIAACFLDVKHREELTTVQLQSDCDAIVRQMGALDLNVHRKSLQPVHTSGGPSPPACSNLLTLNVDGPSPPFSTLTHEWLLENLHNPYPSAEIKAHIATASSCQASSINSWFINARRRIGWTTLCRERFSNCRADMIDAAYRALVEEDPCRVLSPDLRHSFVAMKVAAEGLYSSAFTRSTLAADLDALLRDTAEKHKESSESRLARQANPKKTGRDSYPSPDRSTPASPLLPLDDSARDESEEDDVTPPAITGSKRRLSSIELVNEPSSTVRRPIKRLRASTTSSTYLPSPPSSTNGVDVQSDDSSPEPSLHSVQLSETNEVSLSRKRRPDDADSAGSSKRLRGSTVTSPLQAPDSLLIENEYSIDDWFNTNFDDLFTIPPPVDATEPDFSTSWEVELFKDYKILGNSTCESKSPPSLAASNDLSDLDTLLQSIGSDEFVNMLECLPPDSHTASFDSSPPDISQTYIDWTSLLNDPDAYPSTIPQYPVGSQPLSEIDLTMLQLPHATPAVGSQGDPASKQVKLHQLHAMQEAVRRMEQELQSEGVII